MSIFARMITPEQSEEIQRTSAQLAGLDRCPICGERLREVAHSHECDKYCPTCGGHGTVKICPNAPHFDA